LVEVAAEAVALLADLVLLAHRETEQLLGEAAQAVVVRRLAGQQAEEMPQRAQQEDQVFKALAALGI
jgi:hypothetical protein